MPLQAPILPPAAGPSFPQVGGRSHADLLRCNAPWLLKAIYPFPDSGKGWEGAKGGVGYQPVAVYWAEQDLVIADEYRDGNVPAGMDNLPLIRRSFLSLPAAITKLYFRADSACYERNVLRWLADEHRHGGPHGYIGFTISADMTPELRQVCCEVPDDDWQLVDEP